MQRFRRFCLVNHEQRGALLPRMPPPPPPHPPVLAHPALPCYAGALAFALPDAPTQVADALVTLGLPALLLLDFLQDFSVLDAATPAPSAGSGDGDDGGAGVTPSPTTGSRGGLLPTPVPTAAATEPPVTLAPLAPGQTMAPATPAPVSYVVDPFRLFCGGGKCPCSPFVVVVRGCPACVLFCVWVRRFSIEPSFLVVVVVVVLPLKIFGGVMVVVACVVVGLCYCLDVDCLTVGSTPSAEMDRVRNLFADCCLKPRPTLCSNVVFLVV